MWQTCQTLQHRSNECRMPGHGCHGFSTIFSASPLLQSQAPGFRNRPVLLKETTDWLPPAQIELMNLSLQAVRHRGEQVSSSAWIDSLSINAALEDRPPHKAVQRSSPAAEASPGSEVVSDPRIKDWRLSVFRDSGRNSKEPGGTSKTAVDEEVAPSITQRTLPLPGRTRARPPGLGDADELFALFANLKAHTADGRRRQQKAPLRPREGRGGRASRGARRRSSPQPSTVKTVTVAAHPGPPPKEVFRAPPPRASKKRRKVP